MPWFEFFAKVLRTIATLRSSGRLEAVQELLTNMLHQPFLHPAHRVVVTLSQYGHGTYEFFCQDERRLPSIPEDKNLTEFFTALDAHNIMTLFAALLFERRIILTSSRLSLLSCCVHAAAGLLYPLYWQHVYIPIMPPLLLDYVAAPIPFLIGVHSSLMPRVHQQPLDEVIEVDLDANRIMVSASFDDLKQLPPDLVHTLLQVLRRHTSTLGDVVPRAFMYFFLALFGNYQDYVVETRYVGTVRAARCALRAARPCR